MNTNVKLVKPVGRVILSDFTSSGYLKQIYTPALVMFTTRYANFAAAQFQAFSKTYTIQCYVGYPLDGKRSDEMSLIEILPQAVGKVNVKFPSYVLYTVSGKIVYDMGPMTAEQLEDFVISNI